MKLPLLPVQMGPADTDTNHSSAPTLARAPTSLWLLLPLTHARSIHLTQQHTCLHPLTWNTLSIPFLLSYPHSYPETAQIKTLQAAPTPHPPLPAASSVHSAVLGHFGALSLSHSLQRLKIQIHC